MSSTWSLQSLFWVTLCLTAVINNAEDQPSVAESGVMEIRMPGALVSKADVTLCHSIQLDSSETVYFIGFEPLVNSSIAHHAVLAACVDPGRQDEIWNCGGIDESMYSHGGTCKESSYPPKLVLWALDAGGFMFPPGVGFPLGIGTNYHSIVLRVHYNYHQPSDGSLNGTFYDSSGLKLFFTTTTPDKLMGILALGTGGQYPPNKTEHSEVACSLPIVPTERLHIFAYRVHTHSTGLMVSGYRIRNSTWTEIGRRNPQLPQSYISRDDIDVSGSDIVAARCTMFNFMSHTINYGETHENEMCSFRALYYTESGAFIPQLSCTSPGPPHYYWKFDKKVDSHHPTEEITPPLV